MADPVVNTAPLIWLGGYDLSGNLNANELKAARVDLPNSQYGDTLACTFPGIQQVDAMIRGFYSTTSGEADPVHAARIITKDASEWPLTLLPQDAPSAAGTVGNVAYNLRSAQFAMEFGAEHGALLPFSGKSMARTGRLDRGTVMVAKSTLSATTNGTAVQLGAITAAQKLVAILHVFSVNGGTWTVTIESDNASNFPTPATRVTFTGATGITRQVVELAGAVTDDWWRAVTTETVAGTDVTLAVVLAITPA
jgi:hypothetical protein